MVALPPLFLDRLKKIIPAEKVSSVLETFQRYKTSSIRINSLKSNAREIRDLFLRRHIRLIEVPWYGLALIVDGIEPRELSRLGEVNEGKAYIQSLSSMLPVVVLDPKPGETILDLCAAPGSKATQMAAQMNNQGRIVAVEAVRGRFYRLKSVIHLLGAAIVEPKCLDGRRYRSGGVLFDRILVDAPCSSEGRFKSFDKESVGYWSLRKIREMARKQRGLLLNACRMLKPGGVLVYSTCTFAPEENEGVVSWVLRKMDGEVTVEPINLNHVECYPPVVEWGEKPFDERVRHSCRVLPTPAMEGFFMAKMVRK